MDKVRVGIIGCGKVTEMKSGPAFQKVPGSSLEMVMRRDEEKLISYAARHGVKRYTTDYRELLEDPGIDLVYVATPPDTHAFYTIEAAKRGKAVYVEKPMARTVKECRDMIKACNEAGTPLYVAYYRRGQPKFLKAKELLASGAIGQVRSFTYLYACRAPDLDPERPWLMSREKAGGGLLHPVGHDVIEDHGGPALGQDGRHLGADSLSGAGDDGNAVTQWVGHSSLPVVARNRECRLAIRHL